MELKSILEVLLFNAQKPLSAAEFRELLAAAAAGAEEPAVKAFKKTRLEDIAAALEQLEKEHAASSRSYRLACVAGAWQFVSLPEYAPWLRALVGEKARLPRLSQPALETLAIIAYRQPMTRAEIEQIRGVSVDGVMQTLMERGLIEAVGRAEVIGRPMTYGTTVAFLEYFGLRQVEDLPDADELRRLEIKKPEALQTVEPGLATATPAALGAPEAVSEAPDVDATPPPAASTGALGNDSPETTAPSPPLSVPPPATAEITDENATHAESNQSDSSDGTRAGEPA